MVVSKPNFQVVPHIHTHLTHKTWTEKGWFTDSKQDSLWKPRHGVVVRVSSILQFSEFPSSSTRSSILGKYQSIIHAWTKLKLKGRQHSKISTANRNLAVPWLTNFLSLHSVLERNSSGSKECLRRGAELTEQFALLRAGNGHLRATFPIL
jgi:hypothetical protein